jgi:hypothetical protein
MNMVEYIAGVIAVFLFAVLLYAFWFKGWKVDK